MRKESKFVNLRKRKPASDTNIIDSSTKGQRFSKNKIDRSLLKHFIIIQTKFKKNVV